MHNNKLQYLPKIVVRMLKSIRNGTDFDIFEFGMTWVELVLNQLIEMDRVNNSGVTVQQFTCQIKSAFKSWQYYIIASPIFQLKINKIWK